MLIKCYRHDSICPYVRVKIKAALIIFTKTIECSCSRYSPEHVKAFAKRSSKTEWKDQGDMFFKRKKWFEAANCYSNAGQGEVYELSSIGAV